MNTYPRLFVAALPALVLLAVGCSGEVKIGALISETGEVASYGFSVKRGIDLALEQVNAEGGYHGKPIQLVYRDDGTDPEKGKAALTEMFEQEDVDLVIGAVSSNVTLAVAPMFEDGRKLLLSPSSSAPSISEAGPYVFRNYPSDILEGTAMASFVKKFNLKNIVIVAVDNEFGNGLTGVFKLRYESKSRTVTETIRLKENAPIDFPTVVEQIKSYEPDAIYLITYVDTMAELLKQLRASGNESLVLASGSVTDALLTAAGTAAENLIYAQPAFHGDEGPGAEFSQAFEAKYGELPDVYAAHGYDALKLIVEAMNANGTARAEDVRSGLLSLRSWTGAAGLTQFDERGDITRVPELFIVKDGSPIAYRDYEADGGQLPLAGGE